MTKHVEAEFLQALLNEFEMFVTVNSREALSTSGDNCRIFLSFEIRNSQFEMRKYCIRISNAIFSHET